MKEWLVDIQLTGLNLERCLRGCGDAGIRLIDVQRYGRTVHARVAENRLSELSSMTESGGWQLTVGRRHGMGRLLEAVSRRWVLCLAVLTALIMVMLSAHVMWRVEIRDGGAYLGDIRVALSEMGLRTPMWKRDVSLGELRDRLEYRYPKIAWIECGWRGSVLLITVHEGITAGEALSTSGCCDVVAARDGIVESVVTLAGTPVVKSGTTVRKGDVLIRGEERGADESVHPVAARGVVMARVWDAATVRLPATELRTVYTGRQTEKQTVALPWFDMTMADAQPYAQQDTGLRIMPLGGLFFPLTIHIETALEADITVQPREEKQLKAEAAVLALQKLREKIGLQDKLIDKWIEYSTIKDGVLQAVAYGERLLDISLRSDAP